MSGFDYLDSLFEPVVIVDDKLCLVYYNDYFVTFFKTSPRLLKKISNINELLSFRGEKIEALISKADSENKSILSTELGLSINGEKEPSYTVVLKIVPIESKRFMICLNDVSVETQLHDKYRSQLVELRSSHEQLLQTDKLATVGNLTAGISHEINNPLTVALGASQNIDYFLGEREVNITEVKNSNRMITESLEKVAAIISNMKDYVHKPEDKSEYCDLSEAVESAIKLVKTGWAKNHVEFVQELTDEPKICLMNKVELGQILVNLLQNAVDALEESHVEVPKITVSIESNLERNCIEIFVKDNGPGIPKDIQEEIFKPFFTTKKVGKGTGLGMAISQKLSSKYRGTLEIFESSEVGTSFVLGLPMIEDSSISHNSSLIDNLTNETVKRILVVDDEPNILNVMEKFIQDAGHLFIGSSSGEEAIKLLKEFPVELIITDYHMPKMNGTEFATKIRDLDPDVPILFLSSSDTMTEFQRDRKKLNILGLIIKPFTREDIFSTIGYLLEKKEDDNEEEA